ncbi:AsmA family protein [Vibrio chagasii]|nr:AsmA family protein [Vibrio chagasii]
MTLKRATAPFMAPFEWRGAKFWAKARQYKHDWSVVNVTVDGLRLNQQQAKFIEQEWGVAGIRISAYQQLRYFT